MGCSPPHFLRDRLPLARQFGSELETEQARRVDGFVVQMVRRSLTRDGCHAVVVSGRLFI